ncbi:MAG: helix-turn-helix domain-containing protein [Lachnospiraceae bacterium]|nr:helix-turn-helix domain-containing protein [Lachnospiraceae bacterium]
MLTYHLDIAPKSQWLRTTPGPAALAQPYFATEAGLFLAGRHFDTARTHKDSYLIFYTLSGEGILTQGEQTARLKPGTALVMDCRQPQQYGTAPDCDHWHHYWVHADGPGVEAIVGAAPVLMTPVSVSDSLRDTFEHLLRRLPQETAAASLSIGLDIHRILYLITSATLREAEETDRGHAARMEKAAEYIREHYAEELRVEDLAALCHVSRSYFLRLFAQHTGTTPYNFLLRTRITRAKELLEMTDLPMGVIAARVGFGGETNFNARFSAIAGITPGQYRKQALISR